MSSPSRIAIKRLSKELKDIQQNLPPNILATANPSNILEWHYVILGEKDTPFEGGVYHGLLIFPPDYPSKPPAIKMLTPNGRFQVDTRLCLSMSDYHPETWSPGWTVATVIIGLHSFMLDKESSVGVISTNETEKKNYASKTMEYNKKNDLFKSLFPELL